MVEDKISELYSKAHEAHRAGHFDAAGKIGRDMEKLAPLDPRTWVVLAQSALRLKDYTGAAKYLTALHEKDPGNLGFRRQLTGIYQNVGYFDEAVEMYRPVFEADPESFENYAYFGHLCAFGGAEQEALSCFEKADRMSPNNPDIKAGLAKVLISLGDFSRAREEIRKALKVKPGHLESLALKVDLRKPLTTGEKTVLKALSEDGKAHLGRRMDAAFALAKDLDQGGEYNKAFPAFEKANALAGEICQAHGFVYDSQAELRQFKTQTDLFSKAFVKKLASPEPPDPVPVFIIGLPRSGTTLVERILSAHPEIGAAGELKLLGEFPIRLEELARQNPGVSRQNIVTQRAPEWRREYAARLKEKGGKSRFVTDKMPLNFPYVGLAGVLFPAAKFIFLERNPMDNCLSMFFKPLAESYPAATSLAGVGDFYRLFQKYLNHWRTYTELNIHNLEYETLVENPEKEIKKLIDFIGLPWDQACLDFHTAPSAVKTMSVVQVREPVTRKYVGQWKNYKQYLEPLERALKGP